MKNDDEMKEEIVRFVNDAFPVDGLVVLRHGRLLPATVQAAMHLIESAGIKVYGANDFAAYMIRKGWRNKFNENSEGDKAGK